jgi:hypothetical protein
MHDNLEMEGTTAMKYVPMVSISKPEKPDKRAWVSLKIMGTCFHELWSAMGEALTSINEQLITDPWLTVENVNAREAGQILLDVYELNLERYSHGNRPVPKLITIKMTKTEALVFWNCLMRHHPPRETHPAFTVLMSELHQILS